MGLIIFITAIFPKFGFAGQIIAIHELAGPIKEKSSAKSNAEDFFFCWLNHIAVICFSVL
jgi:hypothetical protein